MLVLGGNDKMKYEVSGSTLQTDFVGILPNGQKCAPEHNDTFPDSSNVCDQCVGVSYASRKGRWIYRCGGYDDTNRKENAFFINIYDIFIEFNFI